MNESSPRRPKFTLTQLLVALIVVAAGLLVLAPYLGRQRESSIQARCSNNLRQMSLAIHEYHDTFDQLPPLATNDGHWTWAAFLPMYFEMTNIGWPPFPNHLPANAGNNGALVRQFYDVTFLCPGRRTSAMAQPSNFSQGQPTDYVAVSTTKALAWDSQSDGMIVYRIAPPTASDPRPRSATTFDSVIDGLGNTAMIGEKHMRTEWLGGQYGQPVLVAIQDQNTIRVASETLGRGLAQDRDDPDAWKFGSAHVNVVFFALGDASVRPVKKDADPYILRLFCCRNDQTQFQLP